MYYPPYENRTYTSRGLSSEIYMSENGSLAATVSVEIKMELPRHAYRPENYIHGESCRSEEKGTVRIKAAYTLKKGSG